MVSDEDAPLLSALKAKRRALAEAQRVPAYVVFPDRTLIEMAEARPATLDAMARIGGVGGEEAGELWRRVPRGDHAGGGRAGAPRAAQARGGGTGEIYDALAEAQLRLARGEDGTGKPLNCTASTLRKIAETRPGSMGALERGARDGSGQGPSGSGRRSWRSSRAGTEGRGRRALGPAGALARRRGGCAPPLFARPILPPEASARAGRAAGERRRPVPRGTAPNCAARGARPNRRRRR